MQTIEIEPQLNVFTVSELNQTVKLLLEDNLATIWVEGEISNFAAPQSGHWYFSLKDAAAQVRCAMFRARQLKLGFTPKDGLHVLVKAKVSLYPNRGEYQLIVEDIEERGEGKLRRAFEVLKKKLEAAGLFDPAHKKPLPLYPKQIGIVTSPTGAAIRDILTVLKRRFPSIPIIIYQSMVQGELAAKSIVHAIQTANKRAECDLLIVGRGGGSLEDLWPFNEEIVAHAIFESTIPIISAVGHEVDFTIADFVADKRAPTPSAAAEIAVRDQVALLQTLVTYQQHITKHIEKEISARNKNLVWIIKHLNQLHPKRRLMEKMQQLDYCELTFVTLQNKFINKLQAQVKKAEFDLQRVTPTANIKQLQQTLQLHYQNYLALMQARLKKTQAEINHIAVKLDATSPLATLQRGYAIVTKENKHPIKTTKEINIGDKLKITMKDGHINCHVDGID